MNPLPVAAALGELVDPGLVHGQPARYPELFADELRQIRKHDLWHVAPTPRPILSLTDTIGDFVGAAPPGAGDQRCSRRSWGGHFLYGLEGEQIVRCTGCEIAQIWALLGMRQDAATIFVRRNIFRRQGPP